MVKKGTWFSANSSIMLQCSCENSAMVKQLNCDTVWLWKLHSCRTTLGLLHACSIQYRDIWGVSAQPAKPTLQWKEQMCSPSHRGVGSDAQTTSPKSSQFNWPESRSWLVRIEPLWSELHNVYWIGEASILLVETGFQESFLRAGKDGRNTMQVDSSVQRQAG